MRKLAVKLNRRQILLLQDKYKTDKIIAKVLGVTPQYIYMFRKKYDVPVFKHSNANANRDKLIYSAFVRGVKRSELAKNENLSYVTICRIIKKLTPVKD